MLVVNGLFRHNYTPFLPLGKKIAGQKLHRAADRLRLNTDNFTHNKLSRQLRQPLTVLRIHFS